MFLSQFGKRVRKLSGGRGHYPRSHRLRLCLEGLEDRTVLSFFAPPPSPSAPAPQAKRWATSTATARPTSSSSIEASNTVSVLLGNGDGTFQPKTDYATGTSPSGVAVGDFNGDGKADIAVANTGANSVSMLLGNGDGTFQPRTDIALPLTPVALTVGDFNGDGKADLAVATENATTDDMTMLLGNGNGTFQAPGHHRHRDGHAPGSDTTYSGGASLRSRALISTATAAPIWSS